jgi:uncharacterized OB-fold protein
MMEVIDVGEQGIEIGTPVKMVYRIKELDPQRKFKRYFWKATPSREHGHA